MEDNHTNSVAIFDLGKDKKSLSMESYYQMTDNALPPLMSNLQLLKLKPHVDSSCSAKYFPTLGEHNATLKSLVCVMHGDWTSYLAGKCFKRWQEACIVSVLHASHLYSWGFVRTKS